MCFLKLLSVSTCQYHNRCPCLCLCFITSDRSHVWCLAHLGVGHRRVITFNHSFFSFKFYRVDMSVSMSSLYLSWGLIENYSEAFDQSVVDHAINDICVRMQCSRHNLNVVSAGNGYLMRSHSIMEYALFCRN
ncbi:putative spo11/DNA topoisomerase VI subunit A [Medicago truncatula]|uniref:Putative spo11/DNA topoisomerase VI subunit A n=1 Tax=Medicago truncatula TaxID=3880 RepID=A0A396I2V5_MEDTR|nr:putative spo11/DNA topoisomerase VI subunit A [Medicago truncatula]